MCTVVAAHCFLSDKYIYYICIKYPCVGKLGRSLAHAHWCDSCLNHPRFLFSLSANCHSSFSPRTAQQRLCDHRRWEAIQYFCCHCCWITTTLRSRDDGVENVFVKRRSHPGLLAACDKPISFFPSSSLQASLP